MIWTENHTEMSKQAIAVIEGDICRDDVYKETGCEIWFDFKRIRNVYECEEEQNVAKEMSHLSFQPESWCKVLVQHASPDKCSFVTVIRLLLGYAIWCFPLDLFRK